MNDHQAENLGRIFDLLTTAMEHTDVDGEISPLLEYALAYTEAIFRSQNET